MDTTLILYCLFSYLLMAGIVISGWRKYDHVGLITALVLSPITMPIIVGIYLGEIQA